MARIPGSVSFIFVGILALPLVGCAVHRPAERVEPILSAHSIYQEAEQGHLEASWNEPWWISFRDVTLDELSQRALAGNLGLKEFAARIEQARARVRQSGARLFPELDARVEVEKQQVSYKRGSTISEEAGVIGGWLSWELDLWGRLRSARAAQVYEARAAEVDSQAARLFLSASVAETYFEILEQRRQLRLIAEQINANETLLDLTKLRFAQGQSSVVDVLQQQEQLAATLSLVAPIEARIEQLEYALDVLIGVAPGARPRLSTLNWPNLPPLPPTGIPSDLLERRPDLVAAQNVVRSLDYRVGEAVAARLPRFSIGGSVQALGDPSFSSLVSSAFANVTAPFFDAGSRKAEVDLQRARLSEALANWSEAYLIAVRDVETALVQEKKQSERMIRIQEQLEVARRLLREARNRYAQGLTDYLPVLNAVVTEQELERQLLRSRRELLSFRVAVHRALGGPILVAQSETPPVTLSSEKRFTPSNRQGLAQ